MATLFRGTDRITVPDAVAADYEADGWSRSRAAGAETDRRDSDTVQAAGDAARPPRARRKADR